MSSPPRQTPASLISTLPRWRTADGLFRGGVLAAGGFTVVLVAATAVFLIAQAFPALHQYGVFSFLSSDRWAPLRSHRERCEPKPLRDPAVRLRNLPHLDHRADRRGERLGGGSRSTSPMSPRPGCAAHCPTWLIYSPRSPAWSTASGASSR